MNDSDMEHRQIAVVFILLVWALIPRPLWQLWFKFQSAASAFFHRAS